MKSALILAVSGLAAFASAQLGDVPPCALTCLTDNLPDTGCGLTDFKCSCSNQPFIAAATQCIQSSCPEADQQKALAATKALCASVGVDLPDPTQPEQPEEPEQPEQPSEPSTSAEPSTPAEPSGSAPAEPSAPAYPSAGPSSEAPAPSPSASQPAGNATTTGGGYKPTISTQPTPNGGNRVAAAGSVLALGLVVALAF